MAEPVTLFAGAAFAAAMRDALVSMGCEVSVSRAVRTIGARLNLGKLDPNHDIARAARLSALNAAIHCVEKARAAAHQAGLGATPWTGAPRSATAHFEKAKAALAKRAVAVRRDKGVAFARHLPEGGYGAIEGALARLLAAETGAAVKGEENLAAAMLAEAAEAGGWATPPEILIAEFNNGDDGFSAAFPASVGALLKDPDFDPFFRIWLVLKAEATSENVGELLRRFDNLAAFAAERGAAAIAIAGGEEWLARIEAQNGQILALAESIKDDTAATREGVGRLKKSLIRRPRKPQGSSSRRSVRKR